MATADDTDEQSTKWTTEMKIYCVERYMEGKSYKSAIEDFRTFFPNHKTPYKSLIYKWVCKFRGAGTVENLNRRTPGRQGHSGRKRIRDEDMLKRVRESVAESPHRSTRRRSQELDIKRSTLQRVLKEDIHLYPYHITTHQKLTEHDKEVRVKMGRVLLEKIES